MSAFARRAHGAPAPWWILGALAFTPTCGGEAEHDGSSPLDDIRSRAGCSAASRQVGGWEVCDNELWHRASAQACPSALPRSWPPGPFSEISKDALRPIAHVEPLRRCERDSDCDEHPLGHCEIEDSLGFAVCLYGCALDSDCGPGALCVCGEFFGNCFAGTCSSDADCGSGLMCTTHDTIDGGCFSSAVQFACQTAEDTCSTSADCAPDDACVIEQGDPSGKRSCVTPFVCMSSVDL